MLTMALVSLSVLIVVEHDRAATARRVGLAPAGAQLRPVDRAAVRRHPVQHLPALDAQTRLLTGRYLEYRVTEKV